MNDTRRTGYHSIRYRQFEQNIELVHVAGSDPNHLGTGKTRTGVDLSLPMYIPVSRSVLRHQTNNYQGMWGWDLVQLHRLFYPG